MSFALVQSKFGGGVGISSIAATLTSNVTAGNALIVCLGQFVSGGPYVNFPTVTDTLGNTYALVGSSQFLNTQTVAMIFFAPNSPGGANTITATTGKSSQLSLHCMEFSGVAATGGYDSYATGAVNGTTVTYTYNPKQEPELLVGYGTSLTGGSILSVPGWTNIFNDVTDVDSGSFYTLINSLNGFSVNFRQTSSNVMTTVMCGFSGPSQQTAFKTGLIQLQG